MCFKATIALCISIFSLDIISAQLYCDTTAIDTQLSECLDNSENQSTYGMMACIDTAYVAWDNELNTIYNLLMTVLTPEEKEKLKTAQRNWIAFRDAESEFIGTYSFDLGGSMYRVSANYRVMELVRIRVLQLQSHYEEITAGRE